MSSSKPWITERKEDTFWDYFDFVGWIVENRELIKEKMIDENNIKKQGNRGISYLPPQMDELFIVIPQSNTSDTTNIYYYWFDYTITPPRQYLLHDGSIKRLIHLSRTPQLDYSKFPRRISTPNETWEEGIFSVYWDFYRIKFKDIGKKTSLINWNELPWSGVK